MRAFALVAAALLGGAALGASPAQAGVTWLTDGSGKLTGANGVVVNGVTYNVSFQDGSCASLFGGCDSVSDFTFQSQAASDAAVQALLSDVFTGSYSENYSAVAGCDTNDISLCAIEIPSSLDGTAWLGSFAMITSSSDYLYDYGNSIYADTSSSTSEVFALFSPSAVPEPATWLMMVLGFGLTGFAVRRSRNAKPALAAG